MGTQFPNIARIPGTICPAIQYVDSTGATQMLRFLRSPTGIDPMAPVPNGVDNVAFDGTMRSTNWYVEGYMQFTVLVYAGDDLDSWLNFLPNAVTGQVLTFFPDQDDQDTSAQVRVMVDGRSNSSNSNVPSGDPCPKLKSPGRYSVQLVLRFESVPAMRLIFDRLLGRSEASDI